jgi:hypothetical protein
MTANFSQWRSPERISASSPAQSPEDLLADLLTLADAVDNLEILVGTDAFDSEKTLLAA